MLLLEGLVTSSILKHTLRVLISAGLELLVVLLCLHLELLLELILDLVLAGLELLNLAANRQCLTGQSLIKLLDLLFLLCGA